jgi:hypothetical protein
MRDARLATIATACAAACVATTVAPTTAHAQLGDLSPGGAMTWSLAGIRAEVGVSFVMAPSFAARRVPRGFQSFTLSDLAAGGDTTARRVLAARPNFADYVLAVLGAVRLDSLSVEGESGAARAASLAFWWVPVRPVDSTAALPDTRARRGPQVVELGLWTGDPPFSERLAGVVPWAVTAPVTVTWDGAGGWRVRLTIPDANIIGACRLIGNPTAVQYPLPAYSTVWAADSVIGPLYVFTYYGHQSQPCTGSWQATGEAPLARALRTGAILRSTNEIGWRARASAYRPR